jgi:hypothetical protein
MRSLPDIARAQKQLQTFPEHWMRPMSDPKPSSQDSYSESEAASALGITLARLHELLDEHIFTEGRKRPDSIEFTRSDLLLLKYWSQDADRSTQHAALPIPKVK